MFGTGSIHNEKSIQNGSNMNSIPYNSTSTSIICKTLQTYWESHYNTFPYDKTKCNKCNLHLFVNLRFLQVSAAHRLRIQFSLIIRFKGLSNKNLYFLYVRSINGSRYRGGCNVSGGGRGAPSPPSAALLSTAILHITGGFDGRLRTVLHIYTWIAIGKLQ